MRPLFLALALLALPLTARAAEDIESLARAAEGQTLNLAVHGIEGHEATVRAFQRRFPKVRVQLTVQNPSSIAPRIVTEQANGVYAWDSWWALTTAMTTVVAPAGGFEPITDYLDLPDVAATEGWHAPEHRYATPGQPYVFIHSLNRDATILFNSAVVKGLDISRPADLLDPRLKGRIAIRSPAQGNNGAYALAALVREEGAGFVRKLMFDQQPVIIDNSRQLTDGALRGDYAVVIGGGGDVLSRCHRMGGCRSVRALPFGAYVASRGVGVLKNPPHPQAARLWVNWLLSREGQEAYVREWAKSQDTGASSLRRDVAPDPRHLGSVPNYADLGRFALPGTSGGQHDLQAVYAMAREAKAAGRKPAPLSAWIVLIAALAGAAGAGVLAVVRRARRRALWGAA